MQTVCECVVILRGIREVSWKSAKAMMAEANFLAALKKMDVDGITVKQTQATKSRSKDEPVESLCLLFVITEINFLSGYI